VKKPEQFDVIVTTNMNGDIISDLTSALVGGLGYAPSANLGNGIAIFEAVHGSAPKYAGKNVINPTAVILSSVMMLKYLGLFEAAEDIEHAVLVTLQDGKLTGDVVGYDRGIATSDYTDAIIANLGKRAEGWAVRSAKPIEFPTVSRDLAFRPARIEGGGGRRHLRRLPPPGRRARPEAGGHRGGDAAEAQDDLQPGNQGVPRREPEHRPGGAPPMPVRDPLG
jgi:hypothetical protein